MAEELEVYEQASQAMRELLDRSKICPGEIVVVGCSTSEVLGHQIGTTSSMEVAGGVVQRHCFAGPGTRLLSGGAVL